MSGHGSKKKEPKTTPGIFLHETVHHFGPGTFKESGGILMAPLQLAHSAINPFGHVNRLLGARRAAKNLQSIDEMEKALHARQLPPEITELFFGDLMHSRFYRAEHDAPTMQELVESARYQKQAVWILLRKLDEEKKAAKAAGVQFDGRGRLSEEHLSTLRDFAEDRLRMVSHWESVRAALQRKGRNDDVKKAEEELQEAAVEFFNVRSDPRIGPLLAVLQKEFFAISPSEQLRIRQFVQPK